MTDIYLNLSLVLGLSLAISIIIRYLRQPLVIGYLITGIIAGQAFLAWLDYGSLESFSQIGITLLLFIVGLGLSPRTLREVGRVAFLAGAGQVIFTTVAGFFIARWLGFENITSVYMGIAFAFSSTVIIVRLLHEKRAQDTLYGRISIGLLLVQDLVAMLILAAAASISNANGISWWTVGIELVAKLIIIGIVVALLMRFLVPRIDSKLAQNKEVLFLSSLALAFIMSSLFHELGFSMELGALLAGIMLSVSPYEIEISSRVRPLRDFFIIIFFIVMGSRLEVNMIDTYLFEAIMFSLFILIGNPLIVMILMGFMGYTKRNSFYVGLTMAQISEFSLILLAMGVYMGHLKHEILGFATLVALITIAGSAYFILHADKIYKILEKYLSIFEQKNLLKNKIKSKHIKSEVILIGCHRLGGGIMKTLQKMNKKLMVIDYDPELVKSLASKGINVRFGDVSSAVFLDNIDFSGSKVIISTIPDFEINKFLVKYFNSNRPSATIIAVASYSYEADRLYKLGATYVVIPPYLGRRYIQDLITKHGLYKKGYNQERKKHIQDLGYF